MSEFWLKIYSVEKWSDPAEWNAFLAQTERILGAELSKLDKTDPPRRAVSRESFEQSGHFIVDFQPSNESRWIFGKFKKNKIDIAIHHHASDRRAVNDFPNSLSIYISNFESTDEWVGKVYSILHAAIDAFCPFYAFADIKDCISSKRRKSGAVNLQQELTGVFWLTYFNK